MKGRHITILLVIIAINLTVIALDRVVDRVIPDAMASGHIQKVAICDYKNGNNCAGVCAENADLWGRLKVDTWKWK